MARMMLRWHFLTIAAAALLAGPARADEARSLPEQTVDAFNAIFGKHPGSRAVHAKGVVCEGEFTPAAGAADVSKAAHLQRSAVRATVRFSDGTGLPEIADGAAGAGPRGMAIRFHLPGGGSTDIVANAFNGFAVAKGEDFLAFLRAVAATKPDSPKPTPVEAFLAGHPKAMKVVTASKPVPASFATEPYFGNNAFQFTNRDGKARFGRYQIRPVAAETFLSNDDAARKPPNFLIDELRERLAKGPAQFRIFLQVAAEGDPVDDATAVWPDDRPTFQLGLLSVMQPAADNDAAQKALGFDPLHLTDGIEASDDPLLEFRSAVYAVSRRRRK